MVEHITHEWRRFYRFPNVPVSKDIQLFQSLDVGTHDVMRVCARGQEILSFSTTSWGIGWVRVWDLKTGSLKKQFSVKDVAAACLAPGGDHVIVGSEDDGVRMYNVMSGKCVYIFETPNDKDTICPYLTDLVVFKEEYVIASFMNNQMALWNLNGTLLKKYGTMSLDSYTLCLVPGTNKMITGTSYKTIRVWNVITGALLRNDIIPESKPFDDTSLPADNGIQAAVAIDSKRAV